jgi:hypothetical protein
MVQFALISPFHGPRLSKLWSLRKAPDGNFYRIPSALRPLGREVGRHQDCFPKPKRE